MRTLHAAALNPSSAFGADTYWAGRFGLTPLPIQTTRSTCVLLQFQAEVRFLASPS